MKAVIYISFSLAVLTLASCGSGPAKDKSEKDKPATEEAHEHTESPNTAELSDAQFKTAGIQYGQVEKRAISGVLKANGLLDVPPQKMVNVSVPMGGYVKVTKPLQGAWVKQGELLAVLENLDYIQMQQDYLDLRVQLDYARTEFARQEALSRENVNALKTLQQSKAAFQSLDVKVKGLREKLRLLKINVADVEKGRIQPTVNVYAPMSGYVTEVNINLGQQVTPSDVMFRIVDTEHLHAELTVFEKDVPRLKIGQKVRFRLGNETKERTASVHLIGREINKDRSVRVHCHLDQEDKNLLPGTYLEAMVETGPADTWSLPDAAVVDFEGKSYVFIKAAEEDKQKSDSAVNKNDAYAFTMIAVQKGNSENGYTEVTMPDGFNTGTPVVVKGAYDLLAKLKNEGEEHAH